MIIKIMLIQISIITTLSSKQANTHTHTHTSMSSSTLCCCCDESAQSPLVCFRDVRSRSSGVKGGGVSGGSAAAVAPPSGSSGPVTAASQRKNLGFRESDSSGFLILRGGTPRQILNREGWNSHVHRGFPRNLGSTILSICGVFVLRIDRGGWELRRRDRRMGGPPVYHELYHYVVILLIV